MAAEAAAELHAKCGGAADAALAELLQHLRRAGAPQLTGDAQEEEWVLSVLRGTRSAGPVKTAELRDMNVTVTPGAKRAFESAKAAAAAAGAEQQQTEIAVGTECKRNGCKNKYQGPESLQTICHYHHGSAVFHETYKYWSCCDGRRAWDWDDFQKIEPCTHGPEHCAFTDDAPGLRKKAPCRHDMFQVGTGVTWNIYAKKVDPEKSKFLLSADTIHAEVYFDNNKFFRYHAKLSGAVEPEHCKVEIKEPKIEVSLRKAADASGIAWTTIGEPCEEPEE
eukprot:TRINITY_DN467_c1_g1_i1.p1 TRINITY_DN467_c1_g1~~TRINITY_DN467_c1_g1_i1.p1  ORF type:complete len:298 (+),score=113.65 TRINITY_DN467_c1_g1_i1:60-896(+)